MRRSIIFLILTPTVIGFMCANLAAADQSQKLNAQDSPVPAVSGNQPLLRTPQSSDYTITWEVLSSGGGDASSTSYRVSMTLGQTATGEASSTTYHVSQGFWQVFEGPCDCMPGNANADGQVNVGDAVYMINFVFKGGLAPKPYSICSGDANKDCQANVGDAVYIINYVFKGGQPPADCAVWLSTCGSPLRK
jgi:hypothetical protein